MDTIRAIVDILEAQRNAQLLNEWRYCTAAKANVEIGQMLPQQMWAIFPTQTEEQIKLDGLKYTTSGVYTLYFLTSQDALDFDAVANVSKQERCLVIAKDFLARLEGIKNLRVTGTEIKTTLMYSVNDRTCTGVKIELRIEEKQPECLAEADTAVSVECVISNPTTTTLNVSLYVESGIKAVVRKGFYYGLNREEQPDEVEMSGNEFTLGGLEAGTTYYVKPFVQTADGITYGEVKKLTTQKSEEEVNPSVYITPFNTIKIDRVSFAFSSSENMLTATRRGVCWSKNPLPTIADNIIELENIDGQQAVLIDNLDEDTKYYARGFVAVGSQIFYSEEQSGTTKKWYEFVKGCIGAIKNELKITTNVTLDNDCYVTATTGSMPPRGIGGNYVCIMVGGENAWGNVVRWNGSWYFNQGGRQAGSSTALTERIQELTEPNEGVDVYISPYLIKIGGEVISERTTITSTPQPLAIGRLASYGLSGWINNIKAYNGDGDLLFDGRAVVLNRNYGPEGTFYNMEYKKGQCGILDLVGGLFYGVKTLEEQYQNVLVPFYYENQVR